MDAAVQQEVLPSDNTPVAIVIICDQKLIIVPGLEDTL